ncbi:PREDICTED: nardilysin-like [Vollenhovia emeryi]|uniref:nardilysin-like n=1 Tax=Vollenhovia emeryi TaxID=411798 RepID=UPI0005F567D9|nr:PREDICTED: nardilysin-like [Vollenhovia emeryi]
MIENKLSNVSKSFKPIRKYDRSILVDNKHYYVFCKGNKVSLDSCMLVFCQIDRKTIQWDVILDFIGEVINQINYTIFKEKTSLIYAPCVDVYRSVGTQGLVIMVQYTKSNVDKYIQEFLLTVMEHINNMSEEMFKAIKELMIQVRRDKKPKTMLEQSEVLWNEILKDQYIFGRIDLEIEELHKLTLRECQQFFKKFLIDKSPNLSVYLIPCMILNLTKRGNVGVPKVMFEKNVKRITDILSFKCSQCLCAMPNC